MKRKVTSITKIKMAETTCVTPPMRHGMRFVIEIKHQIAEIPTPTAPARAKIFQLLIIYTNNQKRNHAV